MDSNLIPELLAAHLAQALGQGASLAHPGSFYGDLQQLFEEEFFAPLFGLDWRPGFDSLLDDEKGPDSIEPERPWRFDNIDTYLEIFKLAGEEVRGAPGFLESGIGSCLVTTGNSGVVAYGIDFRVVTSGGYPELRMGIWTAEGQWAGIHDLLFANKDLVHEIVLSTANPSPKSSKSEPPVSYVNFAGDYTLEYATRKATHLSNAFLVCSECQVPIPRTAFSDDDVCDSCSGIVH